MPLKLSLKPGERFVLNGAVVQNGDRRGSLILAVLAQLRTEHYGYALRKALADTFSTNPKYRNVTSVFKALEEASETAKVGTRQLPTVELTIVVQLEAGEEDAPPPPKFTGRKSRTAE